MSVMKQRRTLRRLRDLLPEILIEAQRCDEITAEAALRRTYEELCTQHLFGEHEVHIPIAETDLQGNGEAVFPLCRCEVLQVLHARVVDDSGYKSYPEYRYDKRGGQLIFKNEDLPSKDNLKNGNFELVVVIDAIPAVDDDITDFEKFTKWRSLIVAKTLEDLFAMDGQPWANPTRYQIWASRASRYLEDYLIKEVHLEGDARSRTAAVPISQNIFC